MDHQLQVSDITSNLHDSEQGVPIHMDHQLQVT